MLVCTVPQGGKVLGFGRSGAYLAAQRGEIPTIKVGSRLVVPVARLAEILGVDLAEMQHALESLQGS